MNATATQTVRQRDAVDRSEPQPIATVMTELLARYGLTTPPPERQAEYSAFASAQPIIELAFA